MVGIGEYLPTLLLGSGKYELTVHTWRPCGSIRDKMARFFIGGTAEIADMDYIARPQDFEVSVNLNVNVFAFDASIHVFFPHPFLPFPPSLLLFPFSLSLPFLPPLL